MYSINIERTLFFIDNKKIKSFDIEDFKDIYISFLAYYIEKAILYRNLDKDKKGGFTNE